MCLVCNTLLIKDFNLPITNRGALDAGSCRTTVATCQLSQQYEYPKLLDTTIFTNTGLPASQV